MTKKFTAKEKGFTLVETLVALSIFTLSILGMIVILAGGTSNVGYAKGKIVSTYLSQEGIELVRNFRDEQYLNSQGWAAFQQAAAGCAVNGCIIQSDRTAGYAVSMQACPPPSGGAQSGCAVLSRDNGAGSSGLHGYAMLNSTPTPYQREIRITQVGSSGDELRVDSIVYWTYRGNKYSTASVEHLFNWQ